MLSGSMSIDVVIKCATILLRDGKRSDRLWIAFKVRYFLRHSVKFGGVQELVVQLRVIFREIENKIPFIRCHIKAH